MLFIFVKLGVCVAFVQLVQGKQESGIMRGWDRAGREQASGRDVDCRVVNESLMTLSGYKIM